MTRGTRDQPSALVTGGSRGIGFGIAERLASQGWALTICARDTVQLEHARLRLAESGGQVEVVAGDMSDEQTIDALVSHHQAVYGSMHALVLAAGVGSAGPLEDYPLRRLDKQFAVNLRAPFALVGRALPLLRAAVRDDAGRGGRIIALTSLEGVYPEPGLAAYGALKAGLISLIRSINAEEGHNGITASAISPAYVDTDMSAWAADRIPQESMITVADVVRVVDLLLGLSPAAVIPHIVINRTGAGAYKA